VTNSPKERKMDTLQYDNIFSYLQLQNIPPGLTNRKQVKQFTNLCAHFQIKNNYIYRKDRRKEGNWLRVIRKFELEPVLIMMHNDPLFEHFVTNTMFDKIRD